MSLGTLTATIDAETRGFVQGVAVAGAKLEAFAREVKKLARDVAQVSVGLIAFAAAAVRMAAQTDNAIGQAVAGLKTGFQTLAVQVAHLVLPAIQQLSAMLRELADWFAGLSPEVRAQAGHWAVYAVEAAAVALIIGRIASLVSGLAGAFSGVATAIAAIGLGTLAAMMAAIVAIIAVVLVLHKAWRENWGGMQEKVRTVVNALSGYWQTFKEWMSTHFFDWFIDSWADIEKTIAHAMNFLAHPLNSAEREQQNKISDEGIDTWATRAKAGAMGDALKLGADAIVDAGKSLVEEGKILGQEIVDAIKTILPQSQGGHAPVISATEATHVVSAQRLGEAGEQGRMWDFYKEMPVESLQRSGKLGEDDEQGKVTAATAQAYQRELDMRETMNEQLKLVADGMKAAGMTLLSKLGQLGEVISSAIQGFQQGGIWGAIIAVIVELLSKFKRFQELIDIGNGQVQQILTTLGPGLNALVDALREFMGASGIMTQVIMQILNPILKIIGRVLKLLSPLIEVVATALSGLAPIFEMLETVLGPIFDVLGYILSFVGTTILAAMAALLGLWQGILAIIFEISKAWTGGQGDQGIHDMMNANEKKLNDVGDQMKSLWDHGGHDLGNSAADASEKVGKLGDTAEQVSRQLTNIPAGFNTVLREWQASFATSSTASMGGSSGSLGGSSAQQQSERDAFRTTGNGTGNSAHRGKDKNATSDL
jgi:hypothetical protein